MNRVADTFHLDQPGDRGNVGLLLRICVAGTIFEFAYVNAGMEDGYLARVTAHVDQTLSDIPADRQKQVTL